MKLRKTYEFKNINITPYAFHKMCIEARGKELPKEYEICELYIKTRGTKDRDCGVSAFCLKCEECPYCKF
jgi:hypothetical protein